MNSLEQKQQGLTLIELVAVIIILAVALAGVTAAISSAMSRTSDVLIETRAVALSQSYLDEILGKRFDENSAPRGIPPCRDNCTDEIDFGPDGVELLRPDFDDVDDYHNLAEGDGEINALQDADGIERLGYENFRVNVTLRYLQPCDAEAALFGFGPEVCSPADEIEEAAAEPILLEASQRAKLIAITVRHRENGEGWTFSVYKSNF